MAGDIDRLADEIQPRHRHRLHRLRRQSARIDPAQRHLGLVEAERARGLHLPIGKLAHRVGDRTIRKLHHRLVHGVRLAPLLREPFGQAL
jgi:hypothetical protein